jgi:Fe-S cluster assembly protein SufD
VVEDHAVPDRHVEMWRFSPLDALADFFDPAASRPAEETGAVSLTLAADRGAGEEAVDLLAGSPASLVAAPLAVGQAPRGTVLIPTDRVAAIAAAVPKAPHLVIPAGETLDAPVRVDITGHDCATIATAHLVIEAGADSSATVLLRHTGSARYIGDVEIIVGANAHLTVVSLQEWDDGAIHLGQHEAVVGANATYRHIAVSFGGQIVRLQNTVSYADEGGSAELLGVYFSDSGQHLEHRLFVDHNHPKGVSHADYRGALQGEGARSVWVGDVLIRPEAEGIETYESNKNLLLTEGCRANAVPNLEIETGEIVGAGHSASTGRFDDEQLFYLKSRGIDEAEARRLVVRGFFAAIIDRIAIPDVTETLMAVIDRELEAAAAAGTTTEPQENLS